MVGKYQEANTSLSKRHEQDLRYTMIIVINAIIDWLRNGCSKPISIIDKVLGTSKVIKESTLTRIKVQPIEDYEKGKMKRFYFTESSYQHTYRLPNKVDNFKSLGRKTNLVKEIATEIVIEMYCIYQESLLTEEELAKVGDNHTKEQERKNRIKIKRREKRKEDARGRFLSTK